MSVQSAIVEVPAQTGCARRLHLGDALRIVALHGEQVADLALFNGDDPSDSFSPGRTIDYNESIRIAKGDLLYSHRDAALARVIEDSVGVHDMLLAPCSEAMFARRGELDHRSCRENLAAALCLAGIPAGAPIATLNVFMDVRIDADGKIRLYPPRSQAGDSFAILALRDLIVGVAACASEKTNNGRCKPIGIATAAAITPI